MGRRHGWAKVGRTSPEHAQRMRGAREEKGARACCMKRIEESGTAPNVEGTEPNGKIEYAMEEAAAGVFS